MSTETLTSASSRSLAGIPSRTTDFTFPTQPTGTNTSGGNNNGGNNGFNGGTNGVNSTLYLFTFLTTLLLLLAVSCGIVVRSFILRRRFHRRVEEAIAAGVLLPSQTGDINMGPGGTIHVLRRHIGEKPKMWEVWINERSSDEKRGLATSEWSSIQPVAATQISETLAQSKFEQAQNAHTPSAPTSLLGRITDHLPFSRASGRRDTPINAASAPLQATLPSARYGTSPVSVQPPVETAEPPKKPLGTQATGGNQSVQVAVLIAMPDPSRPRYIPGPLLDEHNSEDEGVKGKQRSVELPPVSNEEHELPEVCIGVAQAQIAPSNSAPAEQSPKAPKP